MIVQMPVGDRPDYRNEKFPFGPQYADRARRNHGGQPLQRLAERGGLSWCEAYAVIVDKEYGAVDKAYAEQAVRRHFAEHPVDALKEIARSRGLELHPEAERRMREICDAPARRGDWMQTYTGRQYWPLDPHPDDVSIDDIAHHLAMICRYCGACSRHYSVAEHSVYVSRLVPPELALPALLHDAPEAYCNDIVRPVKRHLPGYAAIEAANEAAIFEALHVPTPTEADWYLIKQADNAILLAEQAQLMAPAPAKWAPLDVPLVLVEQAHDLLRAAVAPFPPGAKYLFLQRYRELTSVAVTTA